MRAIADSKGRVVPVVAGVAALIVATCSACGSSSSKGASSSGTTTAVTAAATGSAGVTGCASTPGVTPTQVKVGVLWDQTGALAASGASFGPAVKAAIAEANQNGGVNGRKLVEVDADSASDPGRSLSAAQGLVQSNGVFAVVNASASSPPMFSYLAQAKIPVVSNYALTSSFASAPNLFTPSGSWNPASGGGSSNSSPATVKLLQQSSVKTMAIFAHNAPSASGAANQVVAAADKLGISTIYKDYAVPFSAFDATSVALRVKQLQPDAVVLEISLPSAISIVQAMRQQGYKAKVTLVSAGYDPSVFTAGIGGPGVYAQLANIPYLGAITALPNAAQDFRNAMAKYAPNTTISNNAVLGWAGTGLLVHGLQLAGKCPTQAAVTSKLRALSSYNPAGMMAQNIQYSPGATPDGTPQACYYFPAINSSSFSVPKTAVCP